MNKEYLTFQIVEDLVNLIRKMRCKKNEVTDLLDVVKRMSLEGKGVL